MLPEVLVYCRTCGEQYGSNAENCPSCGENNIAVNSFFAMCSPTHVNTDELLVNFQGMTQSHPLGTVPTKMPRWPLYVCSAVIIVFLLYTYGPFDHSKVKIGHGDDLNP